MKKLAILTVVFSFIPLISTEIYSQGMRGSLELFFSALDLSEGDSCIIGIEAISGLTRWALDGEIRLPTEGRDSYTR